MRRFSVPRGVMARPIQGATVLMNAQTGRYFTLDEVGSRAWTLLTTLSSMQEARDRLQAEYQADADELTRDLEALVERLVSHGLLDEVTG
ncbi:MAG: PqqD family protein [Acidobacteriota bacterium]